MTMKHRTATSFLLWMLPLFIIQAEVTLASPPGCSGNVQNFAAPALPDDEKQCMDWTSKGDYEYPGEFTYENYVEEYVCPTSDVRIIRSNSIPDHDVTVKTQNYPCVIPWFITLPLTPVKLTAKSEVPGGGIIAMAINGVPAYGAKEASDGANAVEPPVGGQIQDAKFWYGHATVGKVWHTHYPYMGKQNPDEDTLLGYAMDGFPIYGPLPVGTASSVLDECNGRVLNNKYQYHVRHVDDVDGDLDYCNAVDDEVNNWRYILGCYHGSTVDTDVSSYQDETIPDDCILVDHDNDTPSPTKAPSPGDDDTKPPSSKADHPNIIIIQPDDLKFYDEFNRPPIKFEDESAKSIPQPTNGLPNIHWLRTDGAEMREAYTASPACGTSRYSTLTGKYPSRAASARKKNYDEGVIPEVTIPMTKLIDNNGLLDCSVENMAAAFVNDETYTTGMFGKWHLTRMKAEDYSYTKAVEEVMECGFETVSGLYAENLNVETDEGFNSGTFSHNMEWMTSEAIDFINNADKPFFMYFNPTIPHGGHSVRKAFDEFTCKDTPEKTLNSEPQVEGMTTNNDNIDSETCAAYRNWVEERAEDDDDLGPIWLDDSIGALKIALEKADKLKDTIIIFQEDHGMVVKNGLFETGIRIPQFVYYEGVIAPGEVNKKVSTIDVAPTIFDFAGIDPGYTMDGVSWKSDVLQNSKIDSNLDNRCLYFEMEKDRAVRCNCEKVLHISDQASSSSYSKGGDLGYSVDAWNLFDLCDSNKDYDVLTSHEDTNLDIQNNLDLSNLIDCHLKRTYHSTSGLDYSECELDSDATQHPTRSPTTSPTKSPSDGSTSTPTKTSGPTPTIQQSCCGSLERMIVGHVPGGGTPPPPREHQQRSINLMEGWKSEGGRAGVHNGQKIQVETYFHVIKHEDGYGNTQQMVDDNMVVLNNAFEDFEFILKETTFTTNSDWFTCSGSGKEMTEVLRRGLYNALNIYSTCGWGLGLGTATLPDFVDDFSNKASYARDGVMINYVSATGAGSVDYGEGDTLVHEVGHWLGLYHTFENGCKEPGDHVDDTPYQRKANGACIEKDSCTDTPGDDPIHNFMNYTPDSCMDHFTPGQNDRMLAHWYGYRTEYTHSPTYSPGNEPEDCTQFKLIVRTDAEYYWSGWRLFDVDSFPHKQLWMWDFGEYTKRDLFEHERCVPHGCYNFHFYDGYGTGLTKQGYFELYMDGEKKFEGGHIKGDKPFWHKESGKFCSSSTRTPTESPKTTSAPTNSPTRTLTPTEAPTSVPTTSTPTDSSTSTPTDSPTSTPTDSPTSTPTGSPTSTPTNLPTTTSPTLPPVCDDGLFHLNVKFNGDAKGKADKTEYSIYKVNSKGKFKKLHSLKIKQEKLYDNDYCLKDGCHRFKVTDKKGKDGICCEHGFGYYRLELDGVLLEYSRFENGKEKFYDMGNCSGK